MPTFTYEPNLSRPIDRLRSDLGDTQVEVDPETGEGSAWLPDETLTWCLDSAGGDEDVALLLAARKLQARLAMEPDEWQNESERQNFKARQKFVDNLITRLTPLDPTPETSVPSRTLVTIPSRRR